MKQVRSWAAGVAVVAGIWMLSTGRTEGQDEKKTTAEVNADVFKAIVSDAAKNIQKGLAKKDKKTLRRLKTEAALIAGFAQYTHGGPTAAERAGIRDAALQLSAAIAAGKTADAKKLADQLAAGKGVEGAKPGEVDIMKKANLDHFDIMKQFAREPDGYGTELHFRKLTGLGNTIPQKEFDTGLLTEAYKASVAMHMLKGYKYEDGPKPFAKLVEGAMIPTARWAEAAGKKDGAGGARMVYDTTIACGACHKRFR